VIDTRLMEQLTLTDVQNQVLVALVGGYRAREGMKDRIRALNEWEIARRAGLTDVSYAEFYEHPSRDQVSQALSVLQRMGLASVWERGIKYDTFIPTGRADLIVPAEGSEVAASPAHGDSGSAPVQVGAEADPVLARLDEIIRLLRSVDAKLGGR